MTLIIPYRDRPHQLETFLNHMSAYIPEADILIVEQADNKAFNRGRLLNIGFIECQAAHVVMHDVDHLSLAVDYTPTAGVTQLASSEIQRFGFLGGVTMYDADTFRRVGGYHNDYFSRAEDNEMAHNLGRLGVRVAERFGVFDLQPHPRNGAEFIPWLWAKSKQRRPVQDQLSCCQYQIVERLTGHIKVKL